MAIAAVNYIKQYQLNFRKINSWYRADNALYLNKIKKRFPFAALLNHVELKH